MVSLSGFSLTCLVAGPGASARCKWSSCFEGPSVRPLVPLLWDTDPRSPAWLSEASPSLRHPWLHGSGVPGPWRRPPPLRWGSAPAQRRLPLALQPLGPQGAGFSLDVHQERFLRPISLRISSRPSTQQVCMQGLRWSSLAVAGDADEQTKPPPCGNCTTCCLLGSGERHLDQTWGRAQNRLRGAQSSGSREAQGAGLRARPPRRAGNSVRQFQRVKFRFNKL